MKFYRIILASALAAFATAAMLAPDLPDGVYIAEVDEHGVEVHTRLTIDDLPPLSWTYDPQSTISDSKAASLAQPHPSNKTIEKRNRCNFSPSEPGDANCGCGFNVDHGNCDAAVADLSNQIGAGVKTKLGLNYYSIRGNVVAFMCPFWDKGYTVPSTGVSSAASWITQHCGPYVAGTWSPSTDGLLHLADGYSIGYMQYFSGLDFCSQALADDWSCC